MKIKSLRARIRCISLLLFYIVAAAMTLAAQTNDNDRSLSPYFFVKGDPSVDHLPLKDTKVEIAVSGVIADIKVVQTYRNEGSRPINANYVFPASTRAAVYSMRMRIGDEVIVAKIKEREIAKKEFDTAKKEGKSASLLEQERPNVFSMSMANLMPRDEIEIELRYTELLVPTDGIYEVVYPTVVGPRYASQKAADDPDEFGWAKTAHLRENEKPTSDLSISVKIAAGVPIQDLNSTSHRILPQWHDATFAELTLDNTDPAQGNRDFILRYGLAGDQIESGLLLFEGEDENFFLYMAQPPQRVVTDDIPAREYVFVVDVSGSMDGFPLDTSKQLLEDLIGQLRPTDYFNVVLFAGDSMVLSETPLPANRENVSRAVELIGQQRGYGGTELLEALKTAMGLPAASGVSRNVVVVTDGYISAEEDVFDYIRGNLGDGNVFGFGIGLSVNRHLIEGIARAGLGEPFVVTESSEAAATAAKFREYISSPLLTDISIRPIGFDIYDVFPSHVPDLLAERPVVFFGKWRGPTGGLIELHGKTGRGDYFTSLDVAGVQPQETNRGLRYLWARSRIAELSGFGPGNISDDRIKAITELGIRYNLLTKYTSFIAVREVIRNPMGPATDVDQPLPLPVGVGNLIWIFGLLVVIGALWIVRRQVRSKKRIPVVC
jgi:Ca-activated chloride channel family protein